MPYERPHPGPTNAQAAEHALRELDRDARLADLAYMDERMKTSGTDLPIKIISVATVAMMGGMALVEFGRGPQGADPTILVRVGHGVAGCAMAIIMGTIATLGGRTRRMTIQERIPTHVMRAIAILGAIVGAGIAIHAITSSGQLP